MDPLSALGLAGNIIQITDFAGRFLSTTREIYESKNGISEEYLFLADSAENFGELLKALSVRLQEERREHPDYLKSEPTVAPLAAHDRQLVQLAQECETVTNKLRSELNVLKTKSGPGRMQSVFITLRHMLRDGEIMALEKQLQRIRKQVDTVLLFSLNNKLKQSRVHDPAVHHFEARNQDHLTDEDRSLAQEDTWKVDLLRVIERNKWNPESEDNLDAFSSQLHLSIQAEIELRFQKHILASLYFSGLPDRIQHIPEAHQETFEWIFNPPETGRWDSFADWLQSADGKRMYWITGKPGSGKSTLMKYLFHHARTASYASQWSGQEKLIKAGFFFWNSGTVMQMSRMGLLKSLLYQALSTDRSLIKTVFAERWDRFITIGGGRDLFAWPELRPAFETLISQPSTKFLFCIDGLDEFDGRSSDLISLVLDAAKHPNVKICVSSRPWPVFQDSFDSLPSLLLERLTHNDIDTYVKAKLNENRYFLRLKAQQPDDASRLMNDVVEKSAGVFLWVYLVVRELLEGLTNADRMTDLQKRLGSLPPDLEALFQKLMKNLEPIYFKHACQLFRLVLVHQQPRVIDLSFADDENTKSALSADVKRITDEEVLDRVDTMKRRLVAHCKCFLETDDTCSGSNTFDNCECAGTGQF
jgi:hypothetical protein